MRFPFSFYPPDPAGFMPAFELTLVPGAFRRSRTSAMSAPHASTSMRALARSRAPAAMAIGTSSPATRRASAAAASPTPAVRATIACARARSFALSGRTPCRRADRPLPPNGCRPRRGAVDEQALAVRGDKADYFGLDAEGARQLEPVLPGQEAPGAGAEIDQAPAAPDRCGDAFRRLGKVDGRFRNAINGAALSGEKGMKQEFMGSPGILRGSAHGRGCQRSPPSRIWTGRGPLVFHYGPRVYLLSSGCIGEGDGGFAGQ